MWKLRTVLIEAPLIFILTVTLGSASLLCSLWDTHGHAQHRIARLWSALLLRFGFVKCRVTGLEKLDPEGSYVLVSNHTSYLDIPVILSSIHLQIRFFAKKGLFSIPFIGWHLKRAGHIPVPRGDVRASLKSMTEGAKLIRQRRISVLLFPEGGRTEAGLGIRLFKEGAAYIAIKAGVPIVPVGLVDVRVALPMHTLMLRPCTVEIHVGDPIATAGMTIQDRGSLNDLLQERVAELAGEPAIRPAQAQAVS